ncbi:hypothetical protein KIW84_042967 [Lathyrus oleraceus]|uniref:Uncharacterized protein n=1 Tax=Pisum sativum TaxID=3888 RepID=A0A9D5ATA7_PEA|nr:hypothetical protein KIW84_042967 [Pisum sativum]
MTKILLKTLSSLYDECMIASSSNDFTEMVNMGRHLEEGVREGRLSKEEASTSKKYGGSFSKKKEEEANSIYPDQHCAYHQGVPDHNIEDCYPLKYEVQKLVKSGMVSFEDRAPNVKVNPLPVHCNSYVNIVDGCPVFKTPERVVICSSKGSDRSVSSLVIRLEGLVSYASDKVVPYKYNATMIENGQEVPLPSANSVVSIVDVIKVTRSNRVFSPMSPKVMENIVVGKKADFPLVNPINTLICQSGESSGLKVKDDDDEVLRLIKKKVLQKVLEQAHMEHDVTVDQFDHIVANVTSCNNLSFCEEEIPEEGRNHNFVLHISMNCKEDALSNVLIDTGLSLNVLPKSTLARLSYHDAPMRYSSVVVKAFKAYSCLLGRPWIHEAGAITSTLHQKLKFVKNGKLIIVGGEKELLVSHLSSFTYVEAEEAVRTPFQALSIANEVQKTGASMSSLKDMQEVVQVGSTDKWGRVVEVIENKNMAGLGFQQGPFKEDVKVMQQVFHSEGFIHKEEEHSVAIIGYEDEEDNTNFITHGQICNNWVVVDVPIIVHRSK